MKKIFFTGLILVFFLSGCGALTPIKGNKKLTIFSSSDLHYLSSSLATEEKKMELAGDGRVQEYDELLFERFIEEVNNKNPDYVILTGDLSFCGEKISHEEIAEKLHRIKSKVLVIPGNHDVYNVDAYSYNSKPYQKTDYISYEEFKTIYHDFGYADAVSYDEASASYLYPLGEDYYGLMLDTTMSEYNVEEGISYIGGYLEESSLSWCGEMLKKAEEENKKVIPFMHHNLIDHDPNIHNMYTLYNADEVKELFRKYNVKVGFSGHLHIQNIASSSDYTDIAQGAMIDYGNRYSVIDIYDNSYIDYHRDDLLNEEEREYSFNKFVEKNTLKRLDKQISLFGEDKGKKIASFLSEANAYYFDGSYDKLASFKRKNKIYMELISTKAEPGSCLITDSLSQNKKLIKF